MCVCACGCVSDNVDRFIDAVEVSFNKENSNLLGFQKILYAYLANINALKTS